MPYIIGRFNKTSHHAPVKRSKEDIRKALEDNRGIMKYAAADLDIHRTTLYNWINEDEELKKARDDAREAFKDEIEKKMVEIAEDPDHKDQYKMLRWLSKTQMRDRGYDDNYDITSGGEQLDGASLIIDTEGKDPDIE